MIQFDNVDEEEQTKQVLLAAPRMIKAQIKQVTSTRNEYPSSANIKFCQGNLQYLLYSLHFLLSMLLQANNESCIASIGQAIMQTTFPNLILACLQLGLGAQMYRQFG